MADDPQRPSQEDPGQRSMPAQRSSAPSTATISRDYGARERVAPPPLEHRPPKSHLPLKIAGIIGVLLLGGLIGGLVAANTSSTPTPAPAPAVHTLSSFGATGSAVSPSFVVSSSPVTSTYGYRCPAGVSGRFTADLATSNGTDSHSIVNTTAPSVSGTMTLHPAHVGSLYRVTVTAPGSCAYHINTAVP
jgi:hypothetical protein